MNIIRLTTRIYPDIGGPAVYTLMLSKNLADKNIRMLNVSCRPKQNYKAKKVINPNFIIHYLPIIVPSEEERICIKLLFIFKFFFYSIKTIFKLHKKHRIDLIHCDNPPITGLVSIFFKKIFKIPLIYTQHGPKIDSPYFLDYLLEARLVYRYSTYYIIISRKYKLYYEYAKKLIWIPNGVELNKFFHVKNEEEKKKIIDDLGLSSILNVDDFIIICIGYMNKKLKTDGMIDLIHGINKFIKLLNENQKTKIKLLFIGDGRFKNSIENEIMKLNLSLNIKMLGIKQDIQKFLAISDLLALTSHYEGFPTVFLEAIASKVPCISTDVGEVKEILDSESIVPIGDIEKIASKFQKFYNDESLRNQVLMKSMNKVINYDWENIAQRIKKIYIKAVRKC